MTQSGFKCFDKIRVQIIPTKNLDPSLYKARDPDTKRMPGSGSATLVFSVERLAVCHDFDKPFELTKMGFYAHDLFVLTVCFQDAVRKKNIYS